MTVTTARFQVTRDPAADWTSNNPVLLLGEFGYETDTARFKIGNGTDNWSTLDYLFDVPLKGMHVPDPVSTGDLVLNVVDNSGESPANIPYAADRLDLALFHPGQSFTASTLEIDVQTAGAGSTTARIYIYADDGSSGIGAPVSSGGPIAQSGDLATDSTGVKTWTPSGGFDFVANTKYWIGIHTSGGPSLSTVPTRHCKMIGYDKTARQPLICHRKTATYGSGSPASGAGTKTFANAPLIIMTVA